MPNLSPELTYTALAAALTGVLWVPMIANRLIELGPWPALKNPAPDARPEADWAFRLAAAHRNAIENLVVFAPLAIAVHLQNAGNGLTAGACAVFFLARLAHAVIYTAGIPLLRTIAFVIGFACEAILFLRLMQAV